MRELYQMEFIGDIKIEDLEPVGYKISIYISRGSENPIVFIADLEDSQFLSFIKKELRNAKLHKTSYFSTTKVPIGQDTCNTPYTLKNDFYKTETKAPPLFLRFKNDYITIPYNKKGILIPVISNTYWDALYKETLDYKLEYEGRGSGYLKIIPKLNYDIDKDYEITLISKYHNITATIKICQIGKISAPFKVSQGEFILCDGQEFLVLRNGILE